ncbi:MAG: pyridoxal phosphate-dependent aminotransferase, partial [Eubacteriales bacterium]
MKELSKLALQIEPSATMAIDTMFKQMKADGIDVIGFGAGEPDFPTPLSVKESGIQAIENNDTRYTPASGSVELRKAIAARLKADYNLSYEFNQIAVSNGAKPCVCVALQVLINPGDEIILPAPYWVSYLELIRMLGGVPVIVDASEEDNFKITGETLQAAITPKTKAIIFNNPSNPTGMIYSKDELVEIGNVCVKNEVYIISDEIYSNLVYNGTFHAMASLSDSIKQYTLTINGVSKSYAMTGWRIGYIAAVGDLARVIANYLSHSTGSPCTISQKAAAFALSEPQDSV